MTKLKSIFVILMLFHLAAKSAPVPDLVESINPMIGASTSAQYGEGKTFPGAATPFGLIQLSPDTITGGDNGSGYSWEHKTIEGFSFTHMSGVGWYGDLGNFQVTPTTGPLKTERGKHGSEDGFRSRFHHETEVAKAGYYAVTLDDYKIRAEMTAAPHAGILRFTFPESEQARIQIDLARRVGGTSTRQYVKVIDTHTIEGWMKCPPSGGGWGDGAGKADYTVYFSAQFSEPLEKFGVWSADIPPGWSRKREDIESDRYREVVAAAKVLNGCSEMEGDHLGFFSEFPTKAGMQVLLKCGISFVSVKDARENLEHDIHGWDFDSVHRDAVALWRHALERVGIEGGTAAQRETFATAMYHAMLDPRMYSDVNGLYTGADGKVHNTTNFACRTIFSGWDVFRSEFPLLTLIRPDVVNDTINSLMEQAELSGNGYLARWEMMTAESGCMSGDPAVSIFTEAYLNGIRNYDVQKAYELCTNSIGSFDNRNGRRDYERLGFVPESITLTLEDAYYDYCAGRFAEALGKTNDGKAFLERSLSYTNVYDSSVGNMHAKRRDDSWTLWKGPTAEGQGCEESNPYQQNWFVPQDIAGLIELMGPQYCLNYLTDFFEKTPSSFKWNEYCNQANEPVHHVSYLFTYLGKPWLTQKWSRFILDHAYGPGVAGICGNEDVGQMSAWYILSAIGFHPVSPVDGIYVIGSPLFQKATIRLDPKYHTGKTFSVIAHNNSSANIYIRSAILNGKPLERAWLRYDEITSGGKLELEMGAEPNTNWGAAREEIPPSFCTCLNIAH